MAWLRPTPPASKRPVAGKRPLRTAQPAPMALRWGRWAVAPALAGLLLALLAWAPARWLAAPVAQWSGGRVQLMNAHGSVWDGQAQVVLTGGADSQDRMALPSPVRWRLQTRWWGAPTAANAEGLLAPDLSGPGGWLSLQADCCMATPLDVHIRPRWSGVDLWLPPHRSQWPAALLMGLGTPWNTLQLQAGLTVTNDGWHLQQRAGRLRLDGRAHLDVTDAASQLSTLKPLGSYRLTWQADAQSDPATGAPALGLSLHTQSGALQLQGQGEWVAGRLRFRGDAQASPGSEDALANLMNLLGRRQADRTLIAIG